MNEKDVCEAAVEAYREARHLFDEGELRVAEEAAAYVADRVGTFVGENIFAVLESDRELRAWDRKD